MIVRLERILIARNDGYTDWKNSAYVPQRGEYAIGFFKEGESERAIVKLGDGEHLWMDLPQTEYVFTENVRLSENFGKYKTELGSILTNSKGKTLSEWFFDAFSEVKQPNITRPTVKINNLKAITNTGDFEIGSEIIAFQWDVENSVSSYEYGSVYQDGTTNTHSVNAVTLLYDNSDQLFQEEDVVSAKRFQGEANLANPEMLTREGNWVTKDFIANIDWSASPYYAVNNLQQITDLILLAGGAQDSLRLTLPVYREGCFFGGVNTFNTSGVNSNFVRGLQKSGEGYAQKKIRFVVPKNSTAVVIACPQDQVGVTSILNITAGAEMLAGNFKTISNVSVDSAKPNLYSEKYKIWYYTPANKYQKDTEFEITLG